MSYYTLNIYIAHFTYHTSLLKALRVDCKKNPKPQTFAR